MATQQFNTRDMLRLEVEEVTPGEAVGLIQNHSGGQGLGTWGWITPATGSYMETAGDPTPYLRFEWDFAAAGVAEFHCERFAVTPGHYLAAAWGSAYSSPSLGYRARIQWYKADKTLLSQGAQTAFTQTAAVGNTIPAIVVPTGAAFADLRFDHYANAAGTLAAAGTWDYYALRAVTATTAARANTLAMTVLDVPYRNIIGPTLTAKIGRGTLDVGTLSVTVADATLDPATDALIRPGRRIRVSGLRDLDVDDWTPLIMGKIDAATVDYLPDRLDLPEAKRARIELTAVDAMTALSNATRPQGVATVAALPWVLEAAGVPWCCNGSGNQVATAAAVSTTDGASAADQVALTRDSVRGEAWIDRHGVLQVWDRAQLATSPVTTIDSSTYSSARIEWSSRELINEVNVVIRRINLANTETVDVTYGPYRDQASINEWGTYSATITVHGIADTPAAASAYAAAVLAANATPRRRVQSITIPIKDAAGFTGADGPGSAFRDIGDRVRIVNAGALIDQDLRVRTIEHDITPEKWLMTIGFGDVGSVAMPTLAPPVQTAPLEPVKWTQSATVTVPTGTAGTVQNVAVVFPKAFGTAPIVTTNPIVGDPSQYQTCAVAETATGFQLNVKRVGAATFPVRYIAHGA